MATLSISLFGSPRVQIDERPVHIPRRKGLALLAFLAVTEQEQRRDTLAALFWPESSAQKARGALRVEISRLNQSQIVSDSARSSLLLTGRLPGPVNIA